MDVVPSRRTPLSNRVCACAGVKPGNSARMMRRVVPSGTAAKSSSGRTVITSAGPMSRSSGADSMVRPSATKCAGESMCVPQCEPIEKRERL